MSRAAIQTHAFESLCGSLWREQQRDEFAVNLCRIARLRVAAQGSSTFCDRNQQKNRKSRKTELKKTGIVPIVKCPTKTVGDKQCRSISTIHKRFVDFNKRVQNIPKKVLKSV